MIQALVIVDLQKDFCPGGALAVPEGDLIVPFVNSEIQKFGIVVATQDWHPEDHCTFETWPVHCVRYTAGAMFHPGLKMGRIEQIFAKGKTRDSLGYSGFYDPGAKNDTGLAQYLADRKVEQIAIVGLATDYCVKATALDGVHLGFDVQLLTKGCRGVNLKPGDTDAAIEEMRNRGVQII